MPAPNTKKLATLTHARLQALEQAKLFSGVVAITKGGKVVFQQAYGQAYPELNVPMTVNTKMVIGENSCLFTAVAIWQLAEARLLALDDPVTEYMTPTDFGRRAEWRPRLKSGEPCAPPTILQLLMMSSGLVDYIGTEYVPGDWQYQHLFTLTDLTDVGYHEVLQGKIKVAELFGSYSWDTPLEFDPGTDYRFSRSNYWLATYVVEKVSGMSFQSYLQENIFSRAGLQHTAFDTSSGIAANIIPNAAPIPGYVSSCTLGPDPEEKTTLTGDSSGLLGSSGRFSTAPSYVSYASSTAASDKQGFSGGVQLTAQASGAGSLGSLPRHMSSVLHSTSSASAHSYSSFDSNPLRSVSNGGRAPVLASWVSIKSDSARSLRVELAESMQGEGSGDEEKDNIPLLTALRRLRRLPPVKHVSMRRDESSVLELSTCFGAGGIMSTATDLLHWYWMLLTGHEKLALRAESVRSMLMSCNEFSRCLDDGSDSDGDLEQGQHTSYKGSATAAYGQGVVVHYEPDATYGVRVMYHSGKQAGFRSQVLMLVDPIDAQDSCGVCVLTNWNPLLEGVDDAALDELHERYFELPLADQVAAEQAIFCEAGGVSVAVLQYVLHQWFPEDYQLAQDVLDVLNE